MWGFWGVVCCCGALEVWMGRGVQVRVGGVAVGGLGVALWSCGAVALRSRRCVAVEL